MSWPLLFYFGFVVILVAGVIGVSYLLGQRHSEPATGEPYVRWIAAGRRDHAACLGQDREDQMTSPYPLLSILAQLDQNSRART